MHSISIATVFIFSACASIAQSAGRSLPPVSQERIAEITNHLTPAPVHFAPTFSDRAFWTPWGDTDAGRRVLSRAQEFASQLQPELTRSQFDEYRRTGARNVFERPFNTRMNRLEAFVFAEGIEGHGNYLPIIDRELRVILSEPSWIVSAHAGDRKSWEDCRDMIDLAAAARSWSIATIDWLLADQLAADLRARIRQETADRIFTPYLARLRSPERDPKGFYWMRNPDNQNPVCNAGVLGSALLLIEDPRARAEFVAAFEAFTPIYLSGFGEDGYCVESIGYWNYGFGHYILGSEIIRIATKGRIDLVGNSPKTRSIAGFGLRWEIAGNLYPAFGDVAVNRKPFSWMIDFSALRFGLGRSSGAASFEAPHPLGPHIYRALFDVSLPRSPAGTDVTDASLGLRDWFPDGGALIVRRAPASSGLAVAIKGGHNGQPHNHNDLGSFVVVKNGMLVLSDLGAGEYVPAAADVRTRYNSGLNNSFGHPVPRVAGQLQRTGRKAQTVTVRTQFTDTQDLWELDLTSAYDAPGLERLTRTFVFTRADNGRLEIIDRVIFKIPQTFGSAIVLAPDQRHEEDGPSALRIRRGQQSVRVAWEALSGDAGSRLSVSLSKEPVIGFLTANPPKGLRLGLDLSAPVTEAILRLVITP